MRESAREQSAWSCREQSARICRLLGRRRIRGWSAVLPPRSCRRRLHVHPCIPPRQSVTPCNVVRHRSRPGKAHQGPCVAPAISRAIVAQGDPTRAGAGISDTLCRTCSVQRRGRGHCFRASRLSRNHSWYVRPSEILCLHLRRRGRDKARIECMPLPGPAGKDHCIAWRLLRSRAALSCHFLS